MVKIHAALNFQLLFFVLSILGLSLSPLPVTTSTLGDSTHQLSMILSRLTPAFLNDQPSSPHHFSSSFLQILETYIIH